MYEHGTNHTKSILTCDICGAPLWLTDADTRPKAEEIARARHGWHFERVEYMTYDYCHKCWNSLRAK